MYTTRRLLLMLFVAMAPVAPALAQAPQFTVELLPAPAGGGVAYDLNDVGMVVGHVFGNGTRAVVWNGKKMSDLAPVSLPPTHGQGEKPVGINRSGIGFFNSSANGYVFNAKSLASGFSVIANAALAGINDAGQLVGTVNRVATFWDGGSVRSLPSQSAAFGLNNFAVVTGFVDVGNGTAMRWHFEDDLDGIELLPALPGGGATAGYAIDDFGNVVGTGAVNGVNRAVAWSGANAIELAALPSTATSRAWDINIDQWVVGESTSTSGRQRATLWVEGVAYELSTIVVGTNPFQRLTTAFGLNDRGEIVGSGSVSGVEMPFILRPRRGNRAK